MAGLEVVDSDIRKRRHLDDPNDESSAVVSEGETASQASKRSSSKKKKSKKRRDDSNSSSDADSSKSKKQKKRKLNGHVNGGIVAKKDRRESLSQPARDPRDSGYIKKSKTKAAEEGDKEIRSPSPMVDFDGLSRPSKGTRARLDEGQDSEAALQRLDKMSDAVRTILECVGEDPERSGILATPRRYARAMLDFTMGYQQNVHDIVNNAIFQEDHNEMVVVKDIEIYSLCEHHLVPFTGKMHIAYIPKDQVIGISKLPRIAEMFSRRLQIQERLTKEVANAIMEVLKPQGVAVTMESSHLCMVMRGVQKTTASTVTSCVLGCFERKSKTRNEFFSLLGMRNN